MPPRACAMKHLPMEGGLPMEGPQRRQQEPKRPRTSFCGCGSETTDYGKIITKSKGMAATAGRNEWGGGMKSIREILIRIQKRKLG